MISKIAIAAAEKIYAISMSTGDIAAYVQSAIDETTEELTGNVDILQGEIEHLETLRDEKDKYIDELRLELADLRDKIALL